jgi:hypothetical protein
MNEIDNEDLTNAFENITVIFRNEIGPYAAGICEHLKQQYIRGLTVPIDEHGVPLQSSRNIDHG